jgi:O-antigen ligase
VYAAARVAGTRDWSLLYNDNLSDIIQLQSIYFAMLINIALLGLGYLMVKKSSLVSRKAWWILIIFLPVHFLLASRMAIIFLYSFVFIFSCYTIVYRKKLWQGLALAAGLLAAALLLLFFFPKTVNRFREMAYTHFDYNSQAKESHYNMALTPDQWNGANIRIAVWECAWTVTRDHPLLGTGLGDKMDELKKAYAAKGFVFGIQNNRNVHNTYLDVWMSLGLIGLLLFLTGFFALPAAACIKTRDWFGLLVIACLFMSLITESYLDRTVGNTMLAFFSSFIASYKKIPPRNRHWLSAI